MPLRSPLAILNELSILPDRGRADVELFDAFRRFVEMLRAATRTRRDLALVSPVPLASAPVDDMRTFGVVFGRAGGRTREEWRFLQQLRSHAPFLTAPGLRMTDQLEEYRCDGATAAGLGLAASNRQLAVSFLADIWPMSHVVLDHHWLEEGDDGGLVEHSREAMVHHASRPDHILVHRDFLRGLRLSDPVTGADLWGDRQALYPHLSFLDRVENDLCSAVLVGEALAQVKTELEGLEEAIADWCASASLMPVWRSRVTTEHEQRRRLCYFTDLDGEERCFDYHSRFTPGPGRIHFRLGSRDRAPHLTIAYVGRKLGT